MTRAHASVNVQNFSPTASPRYVLTEGAQPDFGVLADGTEDPGMSALYVWGFWNYLNEPLVVLDPTRTTRLGTIIDRLNTFNLGLGYGISSSTGIFVDAPIHLVGRAADTSTIGFGDIRVFAKFRVTDSRSVFAVALVPELHLPTGSQTLSVSDGTIAGGLAFAGELDLGGAMLSANVGYRYSPGADFLDLTAVHRFPLRVGAYLPLSPMFAFNAEFASDILVPFNRYVNPSEFYGGINFAATDELRLYAGASLGSLNTIASSDFRIVAGIRAIPLFASAPKPAPSAPVPPKPAAQLEPVAPPPVVRAQPRVFFRETIIEITEEVKFEHAKDVLTASGRDLLDEVADVIRRNQGKYSKILIEGHCNELGSDAYNLKLSEARALAVREYLGSRGIPRERLETKGFGKQMLKSQNYRRLSRAARLQMDRRVAFKIVAPRPVVAPAASSARVKTQQ